ncbi:MAG: response regulator [Anaerolineae bacterium]|nr:response regulator [Anaerolineae bacterium]
MIEQDSQKLKKLQPRDQTRKPIHILYVEDTEVMRDTIGQLLEIYGYEMAYAKNGKEGVEMTLQLRPDLVLMDLRMPVMDGFQAMHEIRFNPQTHHIPIFVVSAWSSRKERDKARLVGADEFFVKPLDLKRLDDTIKRTLAASTQKPQ